MTHTPSPPPLVRLQKVTVSRGGAVLLEVGDYSLLPGARLAVLGANGAGKSTLLRLLRGDIPPDPGAGTRVYRLPGPDGAQPDEAQSTPLGLRQRLALVSGDMQDLYARNQWAITALEAVLTGFSDTPLLYAEPGAEKRAKASAVIEELGLTHLAARRMARLSTGQARAVLLARALVCEPEALFLDECLEGLDARARRRFLAAIDRAASARPALALLFASHRTDELPASLSGAVLVAGGRVRAAESLGAGLRWHEESRSATPEPATMPEGNAPALPLETDAVQPDFLVRIQNADVTLNGATILSGIDWTIRPDEHWVVAGENGAGKSTLLALLAGDFWPSALAGEPGTVAYGFARADETLDELRRRIGRVSPAMDRDYAQELGEDPRLVEVVLSGAFGSIGLYAEPDQAARERAAGLMDFFGIARLAGRRMGTLSRGQLRRATLARALMTGGEAGPALLLLDEPMAGLDARARARVRELLERLAAAGVPLVMVTHHDRDLPAAMNRVLRMEGGRVAEIAALK